MKTGTVFLTVLCFQYSQTAGDLLMEEHAGLICTALFPPSSLVPLHKAQSRLSQEVAAQQKSLCGIMLSIKTTIT